MQKTAIQVIRDDLKNGVIDTPETLETRLRNLRSKHQKAMTDKELAALDELLDGFKKSEAQRTGLIGETIAGWWLPILQKAF